MLPQLNITTMFNVVAYTLFIYDFVLTFADEVERFWSRPRRSWAFPLFTAIRYITLLGRVPAFAANFLPSRSGSRSSVCDGLVLADQVTMGIVQVMCSIVMTLRVYAIYGENRRVLFLLFSIIGLAMGIGLCAVFFKPSLSTTPVQSHGCLHFISPRQFVFIMISHCTGLVFIGMLFTFRSPGYAAAWSAQLFFDAMVFGLMIWKLLRMESMGRRSLVDILLRDGAMYFAVMTAINAANIIIFIAGPPNMKSVLSSPTNMLCAILISRLMLNLRDTAREDIGVLCAQNVNISPGETSSRVRRPSWREEPFSGVDWRSVRN
ncbi:hypothetical protein F5141DRAFT_1127093 [Pisolithus sp. B1]|nr:hypothetical protein F5141DRAFT_1127093 [Pisolithus sp. B1]